MNIQIYGAAKCFATKKAERYFKERNIKYQYIDLHKYGMSKGELAAVRDAVGLNLLFQQDSPEYRRLNLQHIVGSSVREELLLKNPQLFKTPCCSQRPPGDRRLSARGMGKMVLRRWDQ